MIHPQSTLKHTWDFLVVLLVIVAGIDIPLRMALQQEPQGWRLTLDWFTTAIFLLDIVITFNTARYIEGTLERDRRSVARDYLRSWFSTDVISALPIHLYFTGTPQLLRLARLLELPALLSLRKWDAADFVNPNIIRLFFFGCGVLLLSHWVACAALHIGVNPDSPAYIDALYWSVTTLTTVGYGDITPDSPAAKIYTMFVMCLGVGMYAYIIGTIATVIAEADFARAQHKEQLDRVNAFMRHHRLPKTLRRRIRNYYQYIWHSRMGMDATSVEHDLPLPLRTDVALHLLRDMLAAVPILEDASPEFLRTLVVRLECCVYGPGDYVIRTGEIADRMFFIAAGKVEVVSDDQETVFSTLTAGSHFGELALLSGEGRTANVRAVEYCDLYSLDKKSFEDVLAYFPEFARRVNEVAQQRGASS